MVLNLVQKKVDYLFFGNKFSTKKRRKSTFFLVVNEWGFFHIEKKVDFLLFFILNSLPKKVDFLLIFVLNSVLKIGYFLLKVVLKTLPNKVDFLLKLVLKTVIN